MKVALEFEVNESLPPDLSTQLRRAVGAVIQGYGLGATVIIDRQSELEAFQRFWEWRAEQRAALEPKAE